jgi:hypothetical protein
LQSQGFAGWFNNNNNRGDTQNRSWDRDGNSGRDRNDWSRRNDDHARGAVVRTGRNMTAAVIKAGGTMASATTTIGSEISGCRAPRFRPSARHCPPAPSGLPPGRRTAIDEDCERTRAANVIDSDQTHAGSVAGGEPFAAWTVKGGMPALAGRASALKKGTRF